MGKEDKSKRETEIKAECIIDRTMNCSRQEGVKEKYGDILTLTFIKGRIF